MVRLNSPRKEKLESIFYPQSRASDDSVGKRPAAPVDAPVARDETRFPCSDCGGMLTYAVGTNEMECNYCGKRNSIDIADTAIEEIDLPQGLDRLEKTRSMGSTESRLKCPNCAAQFSLEKHLHASDCPFCGTTVVTSTGDVPVSYTHLTLPTICSV